MDGLMMDWLYDELDPSSSAKVAQHVDGCSRCSTEMAALRRTRAAFRGMSHLEPPAAISAILLHEAARRSPGAMVAEGAARHSPFWERVRAWLRPIGNHPGLAAMASLMLVAGVAGALYVRRGWDIGAPHELPDTAPAAAPATTPPGPEQTVFADQAEREKGGAAGALEQNGPQAVAPGPAQTQSAAPEPEKTRGGERGDGFAAGLLDGDKEADLREAEYAQAPEETARRRQAPQSKVAEARAEKEAKKSVASRDRSQSQAESQAEGDINRRGLDPAAADVLASEGAGAKPTTNAVSGAAPAADPETVAPGGAAVATGKSDDARTRALSKQEAGWLSVQEQRLTALARGKRCREAAAIANDILDRNPEYYVRRIRDSKDVEPCRSFVGVETKRRAARRAKAPRSKAAGASQKAKAAPARDEAAAEQPGD
jgi:hypothetical protein